MKDANFEKTLEDLEKIVSELENGDLSLDASLKRYEEGIKFARICREKLDRAKKKINILMKKGEDLFEEKDFEEE